MPKSNVYYDVTDQEQYLDAAVANDIIIIETNYNWSHLGFSQVYYIETRDSVINFRLKALIELQLLH